MIERVKLDIYDYPDGHEFTVVPCEYCGTYYEPGGKEHKCKKKPKTENLSCTGKNCPLELGKVERCTVHNCVDRTKPTSFDKITESVESFVEWVLDTYHCVPEQIPCKPSCNNDCGECFKNWLQREAK